MKTMCIYLCLGTLGMYSVAVAAVIFLSFHFTLCLVQSKCQFGQFFFLFLSGNSVFISF